MSCHVNSTEEVLVIVKLRSAEYYQVVTFFI